MFREKATSGRRDFKSGLNAEEQRTKRADQAVTLRKQEREEQLARRRRQNVDEEEDTGAALPTSQELAELITHLQNPDPAAALEAAKKIRQFLSLERNPPIDIVIGLGGVPRLIALLDSTYPKIVFEAAWALTNIASGTSENTRAVVEAGAVPRFITLLDCPDEEVRDQAVWALGNITGESSTYRDMVLNLDAMSKLLRIAHSQVKLCMLRNVAWTLSNFCRGKNPQPNFGIVSVALPTLYNMIHFDDDDVIADACWALSYLSDDMGGDDLPENAKIEAVISAGVVPRLVQLLSHPSHHVKTPALRAIGNIVTGNNMQTQTVLNQGVLPVLLSLLNNQRRSIRKEACWTVSNITAGTIDQIRQVMHANIFHKILDMIDQADISVKKEIAWTISNALSNDEKDIVSFLVTIGVVPRLGDLLRSEDSQLNLIVLDSLDHLLAFGQKVAVDGDNSMATLIENAGILDTLEVLQSTASQEVYDKAYNIVTKYFSSDVEERVVGAPEVGAEGTFQFSSGNDNAAFDF